MLKPGHGLMHARSFLPVAGIALALCVWELSVRLGSVSPKYFPTFSSVIVELGTLVQTADFWANVLLTLRTWLTGLGIALAAGTACGLLMGMSVTVRRVTQSTVEFLRPIPSVALIPLAVLLFGTRIGSALLLIVYASFWQILLQTIHGVTDIDRVADDVTRSYHIGGWQRIVHLVLPSALPHILTGLRLASSIALILALTAELIIGTPGLGKQVALAEAGGAVVELYALVLCVGLLGIAANLLVRLLESRLLSWHPSRRKES